MCILKLKEFTLNIDLSVQLIKLHNIHYSVLLYYQKARVDYIVDLREVPDWVLYAKNQPL